LAVIREPLMVRESTPVFRVLEQFKRAPVRIAIIVDEYGTLEGIVSNKEAVCRNKSENGQDAQHGRTSGIAGEWA
jgi:Mg2+/Co2+ transporter CorB